MDHLVGTKVLIPLTMLPVDQIDGEGMWVGLVNLSSIKRFKG